MTKSRKFQPDRTYHVTHRCHNREYLLKTDIDCKEYMRLLWSASQRWKVSLFSYIITSNHVHLLLTAPKLEELSGFMGHVSGGMSHYYNRRKKRLGSFWEGRYRTTLIQDGSHLSRCMFYIAMNMVRAGVVDHPSEWGWSSHNELLGQRKRYKLLDIDRFIRKLDCGSHEQFVQWYNKTLQAKCSQKEKLKREPWWSESSCIGDSEFVEEFAGANKEMYIQNYNDEVYYL